MKTKKHASKLLSLVLALALMASLAVPALAADGDSTLNGDIDADQERAQTYTYQAPTEPMEVDENIITASAHRAASPILGIMGVNAKSGFGMINGSAPDDLASAQSCAALGVWGTSINDSPDPYYWNYFYNFYAAETEGVEETDNALINGAWSGSPTSADTTLFEEYGNLSGSIYTRPDILVGVDASNSGDSYEQQLATIASFYEYDENGNVVPTSEFYQEGDENYNPQLVVYATTYIRQMMDSMYRLADAIDEVAAETGKTTRYGDVQEIAADYEKFVYGIIAYVEEELAANGLEEKTCAVINAINDDGTYTLVDAASRSATSVVRAYEYTAPVSKELSEEYPDLIVTKEQLMEADVIVTINNQNISYTDLIDSFDGDEYEGIIISNTPSSLYGVTMNSVENAMGYAYVIGCMYCDVIDIDPVDLCAYFYEHFYHISDRDGIATVVLTNFADCIMPEGIAAQLSDTYSARSVETKIAKGMEYFESNPEQFTADVKAIYGEDYIDIEDWDVNWDLGIGTVDKTALQNVYDESLTIGSAAYTEESYAALVEAQEAAAVVLAAEDMSLLNGQDAVDAAQEALEAAIDALEIYFVDVERYQEDGTEYWYYDAVIWAVETGVTTGTNDGTTFEPFTVCDRSQAVTFLYRLAGENPVEDVENPFADVSEDDWYYDAVLWAVSEGITVGTGTNDDGEMLFSPKQTCDREQIVTFLYRYDGETPIEDVENPFVDVTDDYWYYEPVLWAVSEGITNGTGTNDEGEMLFSPNADCDREQIVTFLYRYSVG